MPDELNLQEEESVSIQIKNPEGDYQYYTDVPGILIELKDTDESEPQFAVYSQGKPYTIVDNVLDFSDGATTCTVYPNVLASDIIVEKPASLSAAKIAYNQQILGVVGNYTLDASAQQEDIAYGKTAYARGEKLTGTGQIGGKGTAYISITGREFSLSVSSPQWDGTLEYSYDGNIWHEWTGTKLVVPATLHLRGIENTTITNNLTSGRFILTSDYKINILGNIENLLDYRIVAGNAHPQMAQGAFGYLFYNCTALVVPPELGSVELSDHCYDSMFYQCSSLIEAPKLPAMVLGEYCYYKMFFGCTKILETPALNAINLEEGCYSNMFHNCSSIQRMTSLPAPTLPDYCYDNMFSNCYSLREISSIPATQLGDYSCRQMFENCKGIMLSETETSLYRYTYRIPSVGSGQDGTDSLLNMFTGTSGDFVGTPNINTTYYWYCLYEETYDPGYLEFFSELGTNISVKMTNSGIKTWNGTIEYYNNDVSNWVVWKGELITGESIKLRGIGNTLITGSSYSQGFVFTGTQIKARGCIDSLLSYSSVLAGNNPTMDSYAFQYLFYNCASLIQAPIFKNRTLQTYCYRSMFRNCSSLQTMPELPSLILASNCYEYMFYGCASLKYNVNLPATTLASYCYSSMFYNCSSLENPPILAVTTLATYCYNGMFQSCSSLINAPELPAITLQNGCYQFMFQNCSSLENAPELPATTLSSNCYYCMFRGCTSLENAPELPVTTVPSYGYYQMFYGCTSLVNAPNLPATTVPSYGYYQMFYNCSSLVVMPKIMANQVNERGCYCMFENCSSLTSLSELPARSLGTYSYYRMFANCTSLEQLPELPTVSISTYCYSNMFSGCSKIKISSQQEDEYITPYRLPPFGDLASTPSQAFQNMFVETGGPFTSTPYANITYYTSNTVVKSKVFSEFNIHIGESDLKVPIYFIASNGLDIDWGDGAIQSIASGGSTTSTNHTYSGDIEGKDYLLRIRSKGSGTWTAGATTTIIDLDNNFSASKETLFKPLENTQETTLYNLSTPYVTSMQLGLDIRFANNTVLNLAGLDEVEGEVIVPGTISYIPSGLFYSCKKIKKVVFQEGITRIDREIFRNCTNLEEVIMPKSLTGDLGYATSTPNSTTFGSDAMFQGASKLKKLTILGAGSSCNLTNWGLSNNTNLEEVLINYRLTVPTRMFAGCTNLKDVYINATSIGDYAFKDCNSLEEFAVGPSTTFISTLAFYDCPSLENFSIKTTNSYFTVTDGILYYSGGNLLRCPEAKTGDFLLTRSVSSYAFYHSHLSNITTSGSLNLASYAFQKSYITSLTTTSGSLTIGAYCFSNSNLLENVKIIINSNTSSSSSYGIQNRAFYNCESLKNLEVTSSSYYNGRIGSYAFYRCTALEEAKVHISYLDNDAFNYCSNLETIDLYGVSTIGSNAFDHCSKLITVSNLGTYLSGGTVTINSQAFRLCTSLSKITVGRQVTSISSSAFEKCDNLDYFYVNAINNYFSSVNGALCNKSGSTLYIVPYKWTSYTLPSSIRTINSSYTFGGQLTSLTLNSYVNISSGSIFEHTTALQSITVPTGNSSLQSYNEALYNKAGTTLIYYPASKVDLDLLDTINTLGPYSFYYNQTLTSVIIPNYITTIGDRAFIGSKIREITIPNTVNSIGTALFVNCNDLTSVTLQNSLTSIPSSTFNNCSSLTSITIPNTVTTIGDYAFYQCRSLTSITIPNTVTTIDTFAFAICSQLTSVTIPNTVTTIGDYALGFCSQLTSVTCLPVTPPTIGSTIFYNSPISNIYVPAESVEAYKAASNWSTYADYIYPIANEGE